ncbi:TIGR02680 family protein [Actinoallomurus sp. NPDC052274]|uniref:TIGR02680 family protein n=1 Tax=Actinoallomurus sp. NPDC052274 TaxID=3155420 RepID=UPI0034154D33
MTPLPRNPHRFRLSRAGIHQVWQYDEEFLFGGGRLLLRGKNGAGKSKALEMLLPFLLDGDTRRIDAAGGGKTTLKWLMLDGWTAGTNRLGYLWIEFARTTDDGTDERLTLGTAVRASRSTGEAKPTFFVTSLAVGDDLPLHDPARRPTPAELRELIGPENCFDRAADYRARVARDLFGLTDLARYRNLVHLLYGLRRPTIGDRIESGELVKVLSDALPPLDDEVIDKVARNLDDLDTVRDELARLERTDAALTTFLTAYRGYLRGVLRGRVAQVGDALGLLRERRRAAGDAERTLARLREQEAEAEARVASLEQTRDAADADLRALRESAAYGALNDLREKRNTVRAVEDAARSAWTAADLARRGEATAADRLLTGTAEIARDLTDLRGSLRDARAGGRACGIDEALLGEPPVGTVRTLATVETETITDPDGRGQSVVRPGGGTFREGTAEDLATWRDGLAEAVKVIKARQRAADALTARLKEVADAETRAAALRQDAERLEAQLSGAQDRERERGVRLIEASAAYARLVREWADRLPDAATMQTLVALPDEDDDLPVTDRCLDRDIHEAVAQAAHEVTDPVLAACDLERDDAVARERAFDASLAEARAERSRWERQSDPEPPRSPYATADRPPNGGAPLFRLLDFADGLPDADRTGLEAALEASGLLGAWVCADGTVLAAGTRDVLLRPGTPVVGPSLADVLRPVPADGVSATGLSGLLRSIGLGETESASSWAATDGRWRLGVARGAYGKDHPEYVGAGVRAATRQRRIAALTARIGTLEVELETARAERGRIEKRRDALRRVLREIPPSRAFTDAWTAYEEAIAETARLTADLAGVRRAAEDSRAAAVKLRARAEAQAGADGLPADRDDLARIRADLGTLQARVGTLGRDAGRVLDRLSAHGAVRGGWEKARADRTQAEGGYATALSALTAAQRELALLEDSVGASEQEILAREREAQDRLDAAARGLPPLRTRHDEVLKERIEAGVRRENALTDLAGQEQIVVDGGVRLRRPLGLPGLPLAAALGDVEEPLRAYDTAQDGDVRARIRALNALADDIATRLGPASADVSDSLILRRGEELRDNLAGGYDAGVDEVDGVKRFALHDDTGAHDVAVVGTRIGTALAEARLRLSTREQEVFERYLLGELGDHLSRQVLAAHNLVAAMNATLEEVRSSHGIGTRLVWELPAGADADIRAAVELLRRPSALRTRDQSARLRDALRRRIEDARRADPSAGYALHLRTALDYRAWFAFRVKVTDAANPDRERVLSHRTALSQGEQRVVSYLVLFATAAAHFSSLGDAAPAAPRLILLDDAFAKVDEPTHGRLLGLLVELDLDFVITSERLFGCFATVPSLHIYECLRDPHVRGVATVHFTWDGRHRRLVGT